MVNTPITRFVHRQDVAAGLLKFICIIQALTAHQSELPERMNKQVAMVLGQDDVIVSCQI